MEKIKKGDLGNIGGIMSRYKKYIGSKIALTLLGLGIVFSGCSGDAPSTIPKNPSANKKETKAPTPAQDTTTTKILTTNDRTDVGKQTPGGSHQKGSIHQGNTNKTKEAYIERSVAPKQEKINIHRDDAIGLEGTTLIFDAHTKDFYRETKDPLEKFRKIRKAENIIGESGKHIETEYEKLMRKHHRTIENYYQEKGINR